MAANLIQTSKKLIKALNANGKKLTLGNKQFMGSEGRPINYWVISEATYNKELHKYDQKPLYSSASMVRICLYLRDMWYEFNGWELPTDQEKWNKLRKEIQKNG